MKNTRRKILIGAVIVVLLVPFGLWFSQSVCGRSFPIPLAHNDVQSVQVYDYRFDEPNSLIGVYTAEDTFKYGIKAELVKDSGIPVQPFYGTREELRGLPAAGIRFHGTNGETYEQTVVTRGFNDRILIQPDGTAWHTTFGDHEPTYLAKTTLKPTDGVNSDVPAAKWTPHQHRWLRYFATGHPLGLPPLAIPWR